MKRLLIFALLFASTVSACKWNFMYRVPFNFLIVEEEVYERVLLTAVNAITLEENRWTTGRRSAPIPQLQCVGGSAGCGTEIMPYVVNCINVGFDGYDVQVSTGQPREGIPPSSPPPKYLREMNLHDRAPKNSLNYQKSCLSVLSAVGLR